MKIHSGRDTDIDVGGDIIEGNKTEGRNYPPSESSDMLDTVSTIAKFLYTTVVKLIPLFG
jgi:hypothetical protein